MPLDIIAQATVQGLLMGAIYALIALSMTLIFSTCGLLNFAHGDFMVLAMFGAMLLFELTGADPYLSAPLLFPALAGIGALTFTRLVRPVLAGGALAGAQLTLGLVFVQQNLLLMLFGGDQRNIPTILSNRHLDFAGLVLPLPLVVGALCAVALSVLLYGMLMATDFGRQVRAIAQNGNAAALMGISIRRVQTLAFALGIGLLGLTGSLTVAQFSVTPSSGLDFTLVALIVMVFGGIGHFIGSLVGGLVIGVAEGLGSLLLGGTVGAMIPYIILVLVLLFRPHGLLGER